MAGSPAILSIRILSDATRAQKEFDKVSGKVSQFDKVARAANVGAKYATAGFAAAGVAVIKIGKAYGELEQNLGGAEAVFGKYASTVKNKGAEAYRTLGLSQSNYLATANKMGSLFQGSGLTQQRSLELTSKAMQRAADQASVMGIDMATAMESITGAAKGNFTMMDNLGVAMNATTLQAYALEKGINFKWNTATQAQKTELAMKMFFDRTSQNAGNFEREASQTISGSFGQLSAAWQNLVAGMGNPDADFNKLTSDLTRAVGDVINNVRPLLGNIWGNLPAQTKIVVATLGTVGAAFIATSAAMKVYTAYQNAAMLAGKLWNTTALLRLRILAMDAAAWVRSTAGKVADTAATVAHTVVQKAAAVASKAWAAAQWLLNAAMSANPIGLVVAAIVALVAGIVIAYKRSETFRNIVNGAFTAVKNVVGAVIDWFKTWVPKAFQLVVAAVKIYINVYKTIIVTAFKVVRAIVTTVINVVRKVITTAWKVISTVVRVYVSTYRKVIVTVFQLVRKVVTTAVQAVRKVVTTVWRAIVSLVRTVMSTYRTVVVNAFQAVRNTVSNVMGAIKNVVSRLWNGVTTIIKNGASTVVSAVKAIPGKILAAGGAFLSAGKTLIGKVFDGFKAAAGGAGGLISNLASSLKSAINNGLNLPVQIGPFKVGPKSFGPWTAIPRLAQGGITTGPTVAMIGDNPGGREAVIPLDKYDLGTGDVTVVIKLDGHEIGRFVDRRVDRAFGGQARRVVLRGAG